MQCFSYLQPVAATATVAASLPPADRCLPAAARFEVARRVYTTLLPADDAKLGKWLHEELYDQPVAPSKPANQQANTLTKLEAYIPSEITVTQTDTLSNRRAALPSANFCIRVETC